MGASDGPRTASASASADLITSASEARSAKEMMGDDWNRSLCKYLDLREHRGSGWASLWHLTQTVAVMAAWWVLSPRYASAEDTPVALRAVFAVAWGLFVLRSYMIFHDCGHGSFFQLFPNARTCNWMCLHLSACMCGTPTDWNVGHALHHANVGNMAQDDYDWAETIFHTARGYMALPLWKRRLIRALRWPPAFFVMAPLLTWYVKMRLPFELRQGRKAAYRCSDKMLSTALMAGRYYAGYKLGVLPQLLGGDYLAMTIGVLLFHLQHVYDPGYVRRPGTNGQTWSLKEAALAGSSILTIPEALKWFTFGIEYHHIHHFRTRIPGYKLRATHEGAPDGMFDAAITLTPRDMWRCCWLELYDEEKQTYTTFAQVEKEWAAKEASGESKKVD